METLSITTKTISCKKFTTTCRAIKVNNSKGCLELTGYIFLLVIQISIIEQLAEANTTVDYEHGIEWKIMLTTKDTGQKSPPSP
ncbi:hypothetical protein T03_5461 [Trichinella britovi]|uniref:Uncharacterized protein n=1 Tax=Trichinella britovi TaxID=45882 RepID=A0A0V1CAL2_TRIBR|nr:hypothetical protein T03_5461 [Trichinella britovi]